MSHAMQQPPHNAAPQYGGYNPPPQPMRNGLGTAALVLGIIGLITGWIPFIFFLGGGLGLLALIMGLIGRGRGKRGEASNKGAATAGAVLGLLAMVAATFAMVASFKAVDEGLKDLDKATSSTGTKEPTTDTGTGTDTGADSGDKSKSKAKGKKGKAKGAAGGGASSGALAAGETTTYKDDLKITVSAAKKFSPSEYAIGHTAGNNAYQVTVTVENAGSKEFKSTLLSTDARAGDDGVTAEQIFDDKVGAGFTGTVLPGKKATVQYAFDAPATAKVLTVEISPGFLHDPTLWELTL
ncbi:DUF4352 domain-containing protein [Streptomyces albipurpureus]|uniref:DUF4352 domain-containing protein n=1 Tax=Streptomyces albipurpureus TaxID=2897419 RepID=A0ABT0UPR1_9ACTN|nr:DUF4352 domain-containing protein [Streptomyces sp. CWNU-1]MCM2390231.1 DUF4352 domain-containing protein [Streptomyces sp. CWNU-1]